MRDYTHPLKSVHTCIFILAQYTKHLSCVLWVILCVIAPCSEANNILSTVLMFWWMQFYDKLVGVLVSPECLGIRTRRYSLDPSSNGFLKPSSFQKGMNDVQHCLFLTVFYTYYISAQLPKCNNDAIKERQLSEQHISKPFRFSVVEWVNEHISKRQEVFIWWLSI